MTVKEGHAFSCGFGYDCFVIECSTRACDPPDMSNKLLDQQVDAIIKGFPVSTAMVNTLGERFKTATSGPDGRVSNKKPKRIHKRLRTIVFEEVPFHAFKEVTSNITVESGRAKEVGVLLVMLPPGKITAEGQSLKVRQ